MLLKNSAVKTIKSRLVKLVKTALAAEKSKITTDNLILSIDQRKAISLRKTWRLVTFNRVVENVTLVMHLDVLLVLILDSQHLRQVTKLSSRMQQLVKLMLPLNRLKSRQLEQRLFQSCEQDRERDTFLVEVRIRRINMINKCFR